MPKDWWQIPWKKHDLDIIYITDENGDVKSTNNNKNTYGKCPYKNRCFASAMNTDAQHDILHVHTQNKGCSNISYGPLCAVCIDKYYKNALNECIECTDKTVPLKLAALASVGLIALLLLWCQRKRIHRLRAKYGAAWRDISRILMINLAYMQVSSSLPPMIQIQWPERYLNLLEKFSFVNVDVVALLGLKCLKGDYFDFRGRLILACCIPVLVIVVGVLVLLSRLSHVKEKASNHDTRKFKEMTMHSVEYLWDLFDVDMSGEINEEEFHNLLVHLNTDTPEHCHHSNTEMRREIMKDLRAVKRHHAHMETGTHRDLQDHEKHSLVILRPHFVELVAEGKLGPVLRDDWIVWSESQRIREQFMSVLLHAPLSQRGFYFFDCKDVGGRWYLQADFTIRCYYEKHRVFVPLAMFFLIFFSFMFPLYVLMLLCRHRTKLHTPEIRHKFGHLYAPFTVGAEYWEIHEVFRKMILTGLLVFIPGNSRAAIAILVSVTSVATLNYFRPHKNYLVFYVAQVSFLVTTFKYLSVILLSANPRDYTEHDSEIVGWLLIGLDIIFATTSFVSFFAVILVLKQHMKQNNLDHQAMLDEIAATGGDKTKVVPLSVIHGEDTIKKNKSKGPKQFEEEKNQEFSARQKMRWDDNKLRRNKEKESKEETKTKKSRRFSNFNASEARDIGMGWWENFDAETGKLYYANTNGKATVWEWPEEVPREHVGGTKAVLPNLKLVMLLKSLVPPPMSRKKKKELQLEYKNTKVDSMNAKHQDRHIGQGWWEKVRVLICCFRLILHCLFFSRLFFLTYIFVLFILSLVVIVVFVLNFLFARSMILFHNIYTMQAPQDNLQHGIGLPKYPKRLHCRKKLILNRRQRQKLQKN